MSRLIVSNLNSEEVGIDIPVKDLIPRDVVSIKSLLTNSKLLQIVKGFYPGTSVGGGQFFYDINKPKSQHNGVTIISPESVDAWDGTESGLFTLLNWSGTGNGVGCYVKLLSNTNFMDASEAGLKPNSNATIPFKLLAKACKGTYLTMTVSTNHYINSEVEIFNSMKALDGVVTRFNGDNPKFKLSRVNAPVNITLTQNDLDNFYEGSISLGVKFGAYKNWDIVLESTEILIEKFGVVGSLNKNDICRVVTNMGVSWPELDSDYTDLTKITCFAYQPEPELDISLNILVDNIPANHDLFEVCRSDIDFKRTCIKVEPSQRLKVNKGFDIRDSVNIKFNDCKVDDILHSSEAQIGHGWSLFRSAGLYFKDTSSSGCNNSIFGSHIKHTIVKGGIWRTGSYGSTPFNAERCRGFHISEKSKVYCLDSPVLLASGSDVSVINCVLHDASSIISINKSTPELYGVVEQKYNQIITSSNIPFSYVSHESTDTDYNDYFSRNIRWPELVSIKNNIVLRNKSGQPVSYFKLDNKGNYNCEWLGDIDIEDNRILNETSITSLHASTDNYTLIMPLKASLSRLTKWNIKSEEWGNSIVNGFFRFRRVSNSASNLPHVNLETVALVDFEVSSDSFRKFDSSGGSTKLIKGSGNNSQNTGKTPTFVYAFSNLTLMAGWKQWSTSNKIKAYNCIFESAGTFDSVDPSGNTNVVSANFDSAFSASSGLLPYSQIIASNT